MGACQDKQERPVEHQKQSRSPNMSKRAQLNHVQPKEILAQFISNNKSNMIDSCDLLNDCEYAHSGRNANYYLKQQRMTIFNGKYQVIEQIGEGKSSRVFLGKQVFDIDPHQQTTSSKYVAIKVIKNEYLKKEFRSIKKEINILKQIGDHENINKLIECGVNGYCVKPSGASVTNIVYMILEYMPKAFFFCQEESGAIGEDGARFYMKQLVSALDYLHNTKQIAHRDLKLENLLIDSNLKLQIADFGLSTDKNLHYLMDYVGTKTYMAPEIKMSKIYDGRQADIFSLGVIMFIMTQGIFPFIEARVTDFYYGGMLFNEKQDQKERYWRKTQSTKLSPEFKELFVKMVHIDPKQRPTIEELKNDPWMLKQPTFGEKHIKRWLQSQQNWIQPQIQAAPKAPNRAQKSSDYEILIENPVIKANNQKQQINKNKNANDNIFISNQETRYSNREYYNFSM